MCACACASPNSPWPMHGMHRATHAGHRLHAWSVGRRWTHALAKPTDDGGKSKSAAASMQQIRCSQIAAPNEAAACSGHKAFAIRLYVCFCLQIHSLSYPCWSPSLKLCKDYFSIIESIVTDIISSFNYMTTQAWTFSSLKRARAWSSTSME